MIKKLLAASIAAAAVAPMTASAVGDVTIYGKAHVMMIGNKVEPGVGGDDELYKNWELSSTNSRLGFKGTEDLGNGLKAIWKYETTVNITDGGSDGGTFGSARNAYLGLSGNWGSALFGRHDSPAKVAFYATGNDHLDGSIVDLNTFGHSQGNLLGGSDALAIPVQAQVFSDDRQDNVLAYISPSFSGFTVAAAVMPGEDRKDVRNANDGIADGASIGAMYANAGFKAGAGWEKIKGSGTTSTLPLPDDAFDDFKTWHLGGSYTFAGAYTIGGNYQKQKNLDFVDGVDLKSWALSGKAQFGNNAVILEYTKVKFETDANDEDGQEIGIALQHNFSKRTSAYLAFNKAKIDNAGPFPEEDDAKSTQYGLGMIHTF